MQHKKVLNIKSNAIKKSLPLILPSIKSKFKTIDQTNPNISQKMLSENPKSYELRKIHINRSVIQKNLLLRDKEIVKNLDIDVNPNLLMAQESEMKKLKENIDNNPDIELKRLGKYKEKKSNDEKDIESKEKVKILEKKFNEDLEEYKNIKMEKEKLSAHIMNIINIIEDYKLELYTFNNYANDLRKQFIENNKAKKQRIMSKMEKLNYNNMDEYNLLDKELQDFEKNNKYNFQEDIKQKKKIISQNLTKAEELLKKLQEKKANMNEVTKELKNKINDNKINLIKLYHISLYEGLDFRYEGLSSVIRAIWNLGVEVDVNYLPRYLDQLLINFLFEHAKLIIKINNWRKQLDLSKEKFMNELEEWKKLNSFNVKTIENSQRSSSNNSDVNLFKTKLEKNKNKTFPKTIKFMKNYYNKYYYLIDNKEKNELNEYKKSKIESKIILPKKFIEDNKVIEKGKIILQNLQSKMKNMEKNEIVRICREFSFNNYGEVYKVCPYIIVSAICGNEYREEGMMFYNMTEKEINDNKRIIRFFDLSKNKNF